MQPGNCQYEYRYQEGKTCLHPPLEGDTLCLFHSQNDEKDITAFWKGIQWKSYGNDLDFQGYYFPPGREAHFTDKEFKDANFSRAIFKGDVDFSGAKFSGENTYFSMAEFSGKNTDFSRAKFSGENTVFSEAKFSGKDTNFSGAEFSGKNTVFVGAKFSGENTDFSRAKFSGENTNFSQAKFSGENTDFSVAEFSGKNTYFGWAEFSGKYTDFSNAEFSGEVAFHTVSLGNCRFYDTDLRRVKFIRCDFAHQEGYRPFRWLIKKLNETSAKHPECHSEPPEAAKNLSQNRRFFASLRMTILRGFSEVSSRIDEKISSLTMRTDVLRDEIEADEGKKDPKRYGLIARSYQQLKRYFQDEERDYARAGEFFYGEMECKRKAGLYRPFLHLYWALSGYGERYLRALVVLLVYILGFSFFYYGTASSVYAVCYNEWRDCLLYSLNVLALRGIETNQSYPFRFGSTIEMIFGLIQSALFFMALRSKLRR